MTGFGRATLLIGDKKITAELRSLNSKQLDLNLKLASCLKENEPVFRSKTSTIAERGKVELAVFVEESGESNNNIINKKLASSYAKELKSLAKELKLNDDDIFAQVLKMPEVLRSSREQIAFNAAEWKSVYTTLDKALDAFDAFRKKEGKVLDEELKSRIKTIAALQKQVELLDKKRFTAVRTKIKKSLDELVGKEKVDGNRFEQELIYYFEKLDISEELLRLKTHCDYFIATSREDACGRKLGFISQEIGREINTIGSKANDAPIQKLVVQMKDELEKIKEQLMNVL